MEAVELLPAESAPVAAPEAIALIGADMGIIGTILCPGPARVFGRIAGTLCATDIVIGDGAKVAGELRGENLVIGYGAEVQGDVFAQEVTVMGRLKGTIRAANVKLLGRAIVEGDIFHQQLSMEEEVRFEGSSRPLA